MFQEMSSTNRQKIEDIDLKIQMLESHKVNLRENYESSDSNSKNIKCKHCVVQ